MHRIAFFTANNNNPTDENTHPVYLIFNPISFLARTILNYTGRIFSSIWNQRSRIFRSLDSARSIESITSELETTRRIIRELQQQINTLTQEKEDLTTQHRQTLQNITAELTRAQTQKDFLARQVADQTRQLTTANRVSAAIETRSTPNTSSPIPVSPSPTQPDYQTAIEKLLAQPCRLFTNVNVFRALSIESKNKIKSKIEEVLNLQTQWLSATNVQDKLRLKVMREAKEQTLLEYLTTLGVTCLINDEQNMFLDTIKTAATELHEILQYPSKIQLIQKYEPHFSPNELSPAQIHQKYQDCQKRKSKIETLQKGINELIKYAQLEDTPNTSYQITLEFTEGKFQIRGEDPNNFSMGYTLFWFLVGAKLIAPNRNWNGEQSFSLTEEELNTLHSYLDRLNRWYHDFKNMISDLVIGDSLNPSEKYISIAQKTAYETLSSSIRIDEEGRATLMRLRGNQPCLLLGQMSLNLDGHPEKEFIKKQLEAMYKAEEMKSQDGKFKQFIIGTDRTNLDMDQIKKICPHLNRYLRFQRHIMDFSGEPSLLHGMNFLKSNNTLLNTSTEVDILKAYLIVCAVGALQKIVPQNQLHTIQTEIEAAIRPIAASIESPQPLYKAYDSVVAALMKKWMILHFAPTANAYEPTEEQITALYGSNNKKAYGNTTNVFRDLSKLFDRLKSAPAVVSIIQTSPEIARHIDTLKNSLEARLSTRYHQLAETGWPSSKKRTQEAIRLLEVFAATIIDQQHSKVTDASIETAFSRLSQLAIEITALEQGCDEGLEGRLQSLALSLSSGYTQSFTAYAQQSLRESVEKAVVEFSNDAYRTSNNSHNYVYAAELQKYFGIQTVSTGSQEMKYDRLSFNAKEMLGLVLKHYTPESLYTLAKSFIENEMWSLTIKPNTTENSERIYAYLRELGINESNEELDKKYRIKGDRQNPFQYALIEGDIQIHIPAYLIKEKLLKIATEPNLNNRYPPCQREGDTLQTFKTISLPPNRFTGIPLQSPAPAYVPPQRYHTPIYVG